MRGRSPGRRQVQKSRTEPHGRSGERERPRGSQFEGGFLGAWLGGERF